MNPVLLYLPFTYIYNLPLIKIGDKLMIVIDNFNQVASQIESERGISRDVLVSAVESALVSACKKKHKEFWLSIPPT